MNNTRFKDGRLGIGRTPVFPLDVSGNTRIAGDLVLSGTIADSSGVPIYFGHAGVTSTDGSNNNYHIGINKTNATDANFPLDVEGNININSGSLFIDGNVAEFSNWTDIGETEASGIYRNTKVAIGKTTANHILDVSGTVNIENGDILLNGTTLDPNPSVAALQDYTATGPTWKDETIVTTVASSSDTTQALTTALNLKADKASPEFSGNVGIGLTANTNYALDISGDINLTGELKLDGSAPVYSNWTVGGTDIFRNREEGVNSIINFHRVYSGNDQKSCYAASKFLKTIINTKKYPLTKLNSTTESETAKILENSFKNIDNIYCIEDGWGDYLCSNFIWKYINFHEIKRFFITNINDLFVFFTCSFEIID